MTSHGDALPSASTGAYTMHQLQNARRCWSHGTHDVNCMFLTSKYGTPPFDLPIDSYVYEEIMQGPNFGLTVCERTSCWSRLQI